MTRLADEPSTSPESTRASGQRQHQEHGPETLGLCGRWLALGRDLTHA